MLAGIDGLGYAVRRMLLAAFMVSLILLGKGVGLQVASAEVFGHLELFVVLN